MQRMSALAVQRPLVLADVMLRDEGVLLCQLVEAVLQHMFAATDIFPVLFMLTYVMLRDEEALLRQLFSIILQHTSAMAIQCPLPLVPTDVMLRDEEVLLRQLVEAHKQRACKCACKVCARKRRACKCLQDVHGAHSLWAGRSSLAILGEDLIAGWHYVQMDRSRCMQ
eukprot:1147937-Pelagomonas_calceolata.AAC.5